MKVESVHSARSHDLSGDYSLAAEALPHRGKGCSRRGGFAGQIVVALHHPLAECLLLYRPSL